VYRKNEKEFKFLLLRNIKMSGSEGTGNYALSSDIIQGLNAISNIVLCITIIIIGVLYKLNNSKMNELQLEKIKILRDNSNSV
jgi:hypothetical protein